MAKDTVKGKQLCQQHGDMIIDVKQDVEILFQKMEVVTQNTMDIEVMGNTLEHIKNKLDETYKLVLELLKEKRGQS
jgi:hypothetical protein